MLMPASTSLSMDFSVNPMSTGAKNLGTSLLENGKTFIDISQNHVDAYDDLTGFEFATAVCPDLRDSAEGLNLEADYYYKSEDPYKDLIEMIQLETKKEIEEVSEFDQILDQVQSQYNSFLKQERKRQEELLNVHPWKHQIDVLFQNHKNANHENEQESGALVQEMITKKNSEVFICFACGRVFLDELLMRKHINDDHLSSKDYPFKCPQCYKKFNLKHHLDRHLKTHNKEHVCTLCNTAFSSFENFIIHKSRVHNLNVSDKPITRQIKCEKCGVQKSSEAELNRHKYWCFNSKKIKKNRLENKIRMSISAPSSTNVSPGGGAIRPKLDKRCEYCNQEFASMQSKIRHFQRKHPDKVDEANKRIYAPMVSPNLQFMCMECHRSFSSHFALKTHQKRHQADSKQFSCDICSRSYILPSELRKHIKRVHEKNDQEPQHTSSTEVSPTGPIKERRGRPPISAQNFAGTPVNLAPIHPTAMLSPQMTELVSDFKKLKNVEEEKMENEDMEREPIEDMPDWNEL